jgi:hypothetical protein
MASMMRHGCLPVDGNRGNDNRARAIVIVKIIKYECGQITEGLPQGETLSAIIS